MRRIHVRIHGRVQGVSYRWYSAEQARRLDVRGWVRNCPDGTVELWGEGDEEALERLVEWCKAGPPAARVTKVDVDWGEVPDADAEQGFEIHP
jgi:acylphosphatase